MTNYIFRAAIDVSTNVTNVPTGTEGPRTTPKVEYSNPTIPPIATSAPSDTSNPLENPNSGTGYTRQPPPELDPKDFPNVKNWYQKDYNSKQKTGKQDRTTDSEDEDDSDKPKTSILSSYMVDENGNQMPEHKKMATRNVAREFFHKILMKKRAPDTWSRIPTDCKYELFYRLETKSPFLRYCDDHWKANMVAINSYSQWRKNFVKKAIKKTQLIDVDTVDTIDVDATASAGVDDGIRGVPKTSKRRREESRAPGPSKRSRFDEAGPSRSNATEVNKIILLNSMLTTFEQDLLYELVLNGTYKEAATNSANTARASNSRQTLR